LNWLLKRLSHHFSVIKEIRELAEMGEWAKASIKNKIFQLSRIASLFPCSFFIFHRI
jgi:hypothetical protein